MSEQAIIGISLAVVIGGISILTVYALDFAINWAVAYMIWSADKEAAQIVAKMKLPQAGQKQSEGDGV